MALNLTVTAQALADQISKTPQLILEVEGIDAIFGTSPVFKTIKWDGTTGWDQDGATWDGVIANEESLDYISFKKTTKSITQMIRPDKSSSSSISTMIVELIDFNKQVSNLFALDNAVEQLGKKCKVYLSFEGAPHPESSIPLFFGFIDDFSFEAGKILMSVSHPENLKRQNIFNQYQSDLTAGIDAVTTTIPVTDTTGIIPTQDALTSYIQIDDELMEVISTTPTSITVVRERLGTIAATHDNDTEVLSILTLIGSPLDLALKIMLSNSGNTFFTSAEIIESFEYVSASEQINNAIIFSSSDIEFVTGLTVDDFVTITGDEAGAYTIQSFGKLEDGRSFIVTNENLNLNSNPTSVFTYSSKYNVLSDGLDMLPDEVDVASFEDIKETFSASFIDYTFYIKETVDNAKEFIDRELFFPQNLYSIPRKARSSVKFTAPPLSVDLTPNLSTENIKNPQSLSFKRSIHKFLYNSITYKYEELILQDKFVTIRSTINTDSLNRIKVGNKNLKIVSKGLRDNTATDQALDRLASRALDRYKFAAVEIKKIKMLYKDGFNLEVGDVIQMGSADLQIPDIQTGGDLTPKLYEIENKSINIQNGEVSIDLIETSFDLFGRRGVFSPSSLTDTGSTTTRLILKSLWSSDQFTKERDKWNDLIGVNLRVRSNDYAFDEETTLVSLEATNDAAINISPALPSIATDYIIELVDYPDLDANEVTDTVKLKYTFSMRQAVITTVTNAQIFDVDDTSLLFEGQIVQVHKADYTTDSEDAVIDDITGNTITLVSALSFTPVTDDLMETKSFTDGDGYVYL